LRSWTPQVEKPKPPLRNKGFTSVKKAESHKTEDSEQTSSQPGDKVENIENIEIQTDSGNVRKTKKPLILSLPPVSTLKAAALTAASKEPKIPKARKTSSSCSATDGRHYYSS
jgi:hypothetical protein